MDAAHATGAEALLPELHLAEQERYRAFTHAGRRESFLKGRALLLAALKRVLGSVEPGRLRTAGSGGGHYEGRAQHLNLSHSGSTLAAAVSSFPVGIDVEQLQARPSVDQPARVFAAEEGARLEALPKRERLEAFYLLWTLKEAACKAAGLSLWEGLKHARFDTAAGRAQLAGPFPAGPWIFMHSSFQPGARLAVALRGKDGGMRFSYRRSAGRDLWLTETLPRPAFLRAD